MKRIIIGIFLLLIIITGCSTQETSKSSQTNISEQDVRNAVTELINGINGGNIEVVNKYIDAAGPVGEKLIEKLRNNIKLYDIRDISIQGTTAQATVTLEVIPLKVKKDIPLKFELTDVLLLNNPLGLLSILL